MFSSGTVGIGQEYNVLARDQQTVNSIITVDQKATKVAINPYQAKSLKHQLRRKEAPDTILKTVDMDRLNESFEDFMWVNKQRELALKIAKPRQAQYQSNPTLSLLARGGNSGEASPRPKLIGRSFVGSEALYNQGKALRMKR